MDELFFKIGEYGALGLISLFLLTKGTSAIKDLADSNKNLADAVAKLSDKIINLDSRVVSFEFEMRQINSRLDKIEMLINSLKNVDLQKKQD